jgi:hypothetical protein
MRDLLLQVDDQEEVNLLYGQSHEADLAPGPHKLSVSNRLFSHLETFSCVDGEEVHFQASNKMSGVGLIMLEILGVGPYKAKLERTDD